MDFNAKNSHKTADLLVSLSHTDSKEIVHVIRPDLQNITMQTLEDNLYSLMLLLIFEE